MSKADNFEGSDTQAEGNSITIGGISAGGNVDGNIVIGNNNQVTEGRRNRKKK